MTLFDQQPVGIYIGIDPGSTSGGLCILKEFESGKIEALAFQLGKMTMGDISGVLTSMVSDTTEDCKIHAVIEKVHAMPGNSAKSMFSFGASYGMLQMALVAHRIPFEEALPVRWMKEYHMKKEKKEDSVVWKHRLRVVAERLFPDMKFVNNIADAVLIAEYCRRQHRGRLKNGQAA